MALIKCFDCGNPVSTTAERCTCCGWSRVEELRSINLEIKELKPFDLGPEPKPPTSGMGSIVVPLVIIEAVLIALSRISHGFSIVVATIVFIVGLVKCIKAKVEYESSVRDYEQRHRDWERLAPDTERLNEERKRKIKDLEAKARLLRGE